MTTVPQTLLLDIGWGPIHEALPDPIAERQMKEPICHSPQVRGPVGAVIKKEKLTWESGDMGVTLVLASSYLWNILSSLDLNVLCCKRWLKWDTSKGLSNSAVSESLLSLLPRDHLSQERKEETVIFVPGSHSTY